MRLPGPLLRLAARQRQRVSGEVTRTVIELASLLPTSQPLTVLPRVRRALVIAPHPDDETLGCGGTLARLTAAGTEVTLVLVTDGDATRGAARSPAATGRARRSEAQRASDHLGIATVVSLALPDGAVSEHLDTLADALIEVADILEPGLVLVPWPLDDHPDHRAIAAALTRRPLPTRPELWGYEVHTPILWPDRAIDVTEVTGRVDAAVAAYASAAVALDLTAVRGLQRYRSLATAAGAGHAEAFVTLDWGDLPTWVAAGRRFGATTD